MPGGFLTLFDQTERIPLSPPGSEKEYWVEIKHHLSGDEEDEATNASLGRDGLQMQSLVGMDEQQIRARIDIVEQGRVILLHHIVNWNLTDRDGAPLPLSPRAAKEASIAALPSGVRFVISNRIGEIRKEQRRTPAERAAFRESAARSDLDGVNGATGAPGVPDGGSLLEASGTQEV